MTALDLSAAPPRSGAVTVSVVLPCLNEAASVEACVREALDTLAAAGLTGEVVVADNGSTDGSAELARGAGARVVHESVPGYGSALRAGIAAARGEVVVMADADFTYDLTKVPALVQPILDGEADLVLGTRLDAATMQSMPFLHRFVGTPVLTWLVARACGGTVVSDSQSGFRAFRRTDYARLGLRTTGMEFASEMLIRGAHADLRITEISTGYRERIGESKLNTFSDGMRHLRLILLLAPHLLLVWPGAGLLAAGLLFSTLAFTSPEGVTVGVITWQPVFFATIAVVLGLQATLAGMVLAHGSSIVEDRVTRHYRFIGRPAFPTWCNRVGLAALGAGALIELALLLNWFSGALLARVGLSLASSAQSLLIAGGTLTAFACVYQMVQRNGGRGVVVAHDDRVVDLR